MPIGGAVSIEFRGNLIFIRVGSLFLGLVLIRRKHVRLQATRTRNWGLNSVAASELIQ